MVDDQGTEEPFDPYAPPPPGQQRPPQGQPYGQPPQGQPYGQAAPGYGYFYPQGDQPPYAPSPNRSTKPLWLGALLGLLLVGAALYASLYLHPDLFPWLAMGLFLALIVLLVVPATRRWGLGILIGVLVSVPLGLIVFAGVCLVIIATYSPPGTP